MTDIVLFHHVQGLTPGVEAIAKALRDAGHAVHTPDLFDGKTFETLDEGMAHAREVGFGALLDRGVAAGEELGTDAVFAGISMGVMPAQKLAQTHAGARGAVLIDSCIPLGEFGDTWPAGVPVQIHGMDADPIFAGEGDVDAARALVAASDDAQLFVYPGDVHLFCDSSLPSYDEAATKLLIQRMQELLASVG
jgi:dienelactone hydrolase